MRNGYDNLDLGVEKRGYAHTLPFGRPSAHGTAVLYLLNNVPDLPYKLSDSFLLLML